ncbi:MAG TPA: TonB family protein [Holophagaceae bacterium]|nr:TonB family protein [Holophagaceae bacterium]
MRIPGLLLLLTLPALAQGGGIPIYLRVSGGVGGVGGDHLRARALSEAELKGLVDPVLRAEGLRLAEIDEVGDAPEGLVLKVQAVDFQVDTGARGYDLSLDLRSAAAFARGTKDPEALSTGRSRVGVAGRIAEADLHREVANQVAALLKARKRAPGTGPANALPPTPPTPPITLARGSEKVFAFDFSQVTVKVQPPPPAYPPMARAMRIQGLVVLEVLVNPSGVPVEITCLEGQEVLRTAAEVYALGWRFEPALVNGEPQWAKFRLRMPFRLQD